LNLGERSGRNRGHRHVMVLEVDNGAAESVRDRRAGGTACLEVGPEHEVVDEELRAPAKEVRQRGTPFIGLESIRLVDPDHGSA